jgi:hypothetical protein
MRRIKTMPKSIVLLLASILVLLPVSMAEKTDASPSDLELTVYPEMPTTADLVEVRVGGGEELPRQALRVVDSATFFAREQQAPTQATYALGALAPDSYQFLLFRIIPGSFFCTHELLGQVRFTVRHAAQAGSGRLVLLVALADREAASALVEQENPQSSWIFEDLAEVKLLPGLEETYLRFLQANPEVADVDFNSVATIPECPLPLSPAIAPGSLLVIFHEGVGSAVAEELIRRLPPELEDFQASSFEALRPYKRRGLVLAKVEARVPPDWEALFLQRYLRRPEVLDGWVLPPRQAQ